MDDQRGDGCRQKSRVEPAVDKMGQQISFIIFAVDLRILAIFVRDNFVKLTELILACNCVILYIDQVQEQ